MTADLAGFLLARCAEDEDAARAAHVTTVLPPIWDTGLLFGPSAPASAHIARWDPARVLAECDAKRQIVYTWQNSAANIAAGHTDTEAARAEPALAHVLRILAATYVAHSDYRQEWTP